MGEREIDLELVRRVQAGDQAAFALLVAKYQRKVARLVSSMVSDPGEVEDVTQETFIKAYRSLANFRGDSAFYTWLYRVAINAGKNFLTKQARRRVKKTVSDDEALEDAGEAEWLSDNQTPELILLSKQIGMTVDAALEELPPELRIAITLREIEGLSYEEIAVVMECPMGTVRSRIFRAREAVSEKLKPLMENVTGKRLV
jgi:RNA polymerase sigma-70 factor (ECF subfamily)